MSEPTPGPAGGIEVPTVDELRGLGRERLMTYFLSAGTTPPDDLDAMARAAHDLLGRDAARAAADWAEYLKRADWVSMEAVLRESGIDGAEGPANESAA
jgi:hypothetical protein